VAAQHHAVGAQRAGKFERSGDPLVLLQCLLEVGQRGLRVPAGGGQQSTAAGGGQCPGPVQRTALGVEFLDERLGLVQLAQADERLDLVGEHREQARLTHPDGVQRPDQRAQPQVGTGGVAQGELQEPQHPLVVHSPSLVPHGRGEGAAPLGGGAGGLDTAQVGVDQCPAVQCYQLPKLAVNRALIGAESVLDRSRGGSQRVRTVTPVCKNRRPESVRTPPAYRSNLTG
jgi:hypothetical protein